MDTNKMNEAQTDIVKKPRKSRSLNRPKVEAVVTETALAMPFPLRPNFMAQVVIPRDITLEEVDRLCAFIKTLGV